jgi:hypothetical protein
MAERTLTQRELNRALLARQLLLDRAHVPLPRALERVGGLQAQYAPSAYIGLWSRLAGFEREDLTRALVRRSVVQGTLMRATIHLVSARDYRLFAEAIRRSRREWWVTVHRGQVDANELAAAARRTRTFLAGAPRRRAELVAHLGADSATWNGVAIWLDLVRVPPSGTWAQRRADLYALAEDWLGPSDVTPEQGLGHLVRRYLGGFGPASLPDLASWAGLPVAVLAPVVERLPLRRFRDEAGRELLDLPRAPLPHADTPAPPRFLPTWDATLLAHARRTQILPERYRARVFQTKTPQSVATFILDGQVAGTWKHERGRIRLEPFDRLMPGDRRALEAEGERLAALLA